MFYSIILIVVLVYLLLIMPKITNKPDFNPFLDTYYAHRGLHDNSVPENSMKAFELAIKNNYGIELDVNLTKDGIPVIFHDHNLLRMCKVDKGINELTYEELQVFRLKNSDQKIPKLVDVLNLVNGKVPLIVELKARYGDFKTLSNNTAKVLDDYKGTYCIESFNPRVLIWFKKFRPGVIRGQLSTNFLKGNVKESKFINFLLTYLCFNYYTKPDFVAYNYKYGNNLSFILCKSFYRTLTIGYTIKSEETFKKVKDDFHLLVFENFDPTKI